MARSVLGKSLQLDLYLSHTETLLLICLNRYAGEGRGKSGPQARVAAGSQGLEVLRRTGPNTRAFMTISGTDLD